MRCAWLCALSLAAACAGPRDTATATDPRLAGPGTPVELQATAPVMCPDPSLREQVPMHTGALPTEPPEGSWTWGAGLVAGDFDLDGYVDLLLPGFWRTELFAGRPYGVFERAEGRLPSTGLTGGSGGAAADYDGDGDLDVLLTRFNFPDVLLRNDRGAFVDVSAQAGLSGVASRSMASSWGDLDGDGDLDLFVGVYGEVDESEEDPEHRSFEPAERSFLYENLGDGTFADRSDWLPDAVHDGYTFAGGWFDLDNDGWLDLYVVNDFGQSFPSVLLWNRQGTLVPDGGRSGLDVSITGMGVGVGDLNEDGVDDLLMTAWNGNHLLLSGVGGRWFDQGVGYGLQNDLDRAQKVAWGVELVDMDNDGDLDAPMAYGDLDAVYVAPPLQPDALYLRTEAGDFVDDAPTWKINHPSVGRGFVAHDFDDDGYLDLVRRDLGGPTLVSLSQCGDGAWLRVRLRDRAPNLHAIGARITAHVAGRRFMGVVRAGGTNHASGGPPEVHLGLGDVDRIDALVIQWPGGDVSRVFDVSSRQILDITKAYR
ncbi:MAG: CRTAC1 family protein [Myxococcales bacterium]|nr:CRTAC1 family protein [Myxococcales bacterium]